MLKKLCVFLRRDDAQCFDVESQASTGLISTVMYCLPLYTPTTLPRQARNQPNRSMKRAWHHKKHTTMSKSANQSKLQTKGPIISGLGLFWKDPSPSHVNTFEPSCLDPCFIYGVYFQYASICSSLSKRMLATVEYLQARSPLHVSGFWKAKRSGWFCRIHQPKVVLS